MARQHGPPFFTGRIGNLIYFKMRGNYYVKAAPSDEVDSKRSNNMEMSGGSMIGKVFRESLPTLIEQFNHSYLNARLAGLFTKIVMYTKKNTGERKLELLTHKSFLKGFEFSPTHKFEQKCMGDFNWSMNDQRDRLSIKIRQLQVTIKNKNLRGTYFRIIVAASVLSNYNYEEDQNKYIPRNEVMNGKGCVSYSRYINVSELIDEDEVIVNFSEGIPSDCSVIALIGIEFYKQEGDEMYLLKSNQALKMAEVF